MSVACSRLLDSAEDAKVKGTRKVGRRGKGKSFLPFYFRVRAFSIQGARLCQSLGQASVFVIGAGGGGVVGAMSQQLFSGVTSSYVHASHVLLEINQFDCCVKEQVTHKSIVRRETQQF